MQQQIPQEHLTDHEQEWFADLWEANRPKLLKYAHHRLKDAHEALDVLSDLAVYMLTPRIYRMMDDYPTDERFRRFAFHNLKYLVGNRLKQRRCRRNGPQIEGDLHDVERDPIDRSVLRRSGRSRPNRRTDSTVVEAVLRRERRQALRTCLTILKERDREVVFHYIGLDKSMDEICQQFGICISTITNIKTRSLATLREHAPDWLKPGESFEETVLRLFQSGVSNKAIAKRVGCSIRPVGRILRKHGLQTDRRKVGA